MVDDRDGIQLLRIEREAISLGSGGGAGGHARNVAYCASLLRLMERTT
jgi:hypothetical protein